MRKRKRREPDIIAELHEDARWSWFTNTHIRWRVRGRPGAPNTGPGIVTWMLAAIVVIGTVAALIGLVILFVRAIVE